MVDVWVTPLRNATITIHCAIKPLHAYTSLLAGSYMFKVNNRNARTRCKKCSKLSAGWVALDYLCKQRRVGTKFLPFLSHSVLVVHVHRWITFSWKIMWFDVKANTQKCFYVICTILDKFWQQYFYLLVMLTSIQRQK